MTVEANAEVARAELTAALGRWLPQQRWFAGTGELTGSVGIVSSGELTIATEDGDARVEQLVVTTEEPGSAGPRHHQLWVGYRSPLPDRLGHSMIADLPCGLTAFDALAEPALTAQLLRTIAGTSELPGLTGEASGQPIEADERGLTLSGEQSNSSIIFGSSSILKVFRRLEPGINPDGEILAALQARGNPSVAPLLGTLTGQLDGTPTTMAVLTGFFAGSADGWLMATASVRDLIAEGDLHADEVGGDFAADSYRLGEAIAAIHHDLAEALGSRPADQAEVDEILGAMAADARAATDRIDDLAELADQIQQVFTRARDEAQALTLQRIHGDLHLGQTLRTLTGWAVIDFEGEPTKSVTYRRSMLPVLRDIGGMLRSYDYAANHLLPGATGPHVAYRAGEWAERNRTAFLDGYVAAGGTDPRAHPQLLAAFELDKAIYEVHYEYDHRPSWVGIPLTAVRRLVGEGESR